MNRMVGNKHPLPTLQETILIITDERGGPFLESMNRMVGNKHPLPTLQETIMIITDDRLGRTRRGRTRKGRTRKGRPYITFVGANLCYRPF